MTGSKAMDPAPDGGTRQASATADAPEPVTPAPGVGEPARPGRPRPQGMWSLFASIFLIELGSAMTSVALPLFLVDKYGINLAVGLTFAIRLVPGILLGPVVGHLVARRDPRRVAAVSALFSACLVAVLPWTSALWQIQLLGLATGVAFMFAGPARLALRPMVFTQGDELKGNGMLVSVERTPMLVGPLLVGAAMIVADYRALFLADAVFCLLAALLVLRLPQARPGGGRDAATGAEAPPDARPERNGTAAAPLKARAARLLRHSYVDSTRGLFQAVGRDRFMLGLTLTGFTYVAAVAMGRLFLIRLSADHFASHPGFFGYLIGAMGLGAAAGGFLVGRLHRMRAGTLYILGNTLEAVAWIAIAHLHSPVAALAMMLVAGLLEAAATAVFFAEVQVRLPNHLSGYYYAALVPLSDACNALGAAVGAVLVASTLTGSSLVIAALMAVPVLLTARFYFHQAPAAPVADRATDEAEAEAETTGSGHAPA